MMLMKGKTMMIRFKTFFFACLSAHAKDVNVFPIPVGNANE